MCTEFNHLPFFVFSDTSVDIQDYVRTLAHANALRDFITVVRMDAARRRPSAIGMWSRVVVDAVEHPTTNKYLIIANIMPI
jgi:hypothetical protein